MKKLIIFWIAVFAVFFSFSATDVFAQSCNPVTNSPGCTAPLTCKALDPAVPTVGVCQSGQNINITEPPQGYKNLGTFITNIISIIFVFALVTVLFMLIWGAFEWITSGGDKEAVGKARGRIINALIGLAVLAIAFALFRFAGQFLGFTIGPTGPINLPIPAPG